MKLPPFEYACPTTLPEAIQLLSERDGDAKPIAGGQSLVPMLAFRLAQPTLLVDLRKLADLRGIRISAKSVTLGAMVRWRDIEDDDFFQGALTTALTPDEIIVEIRLPAWPAGRRWGFEEFARRRGDFAMAAAALFYDQSADGKGRNAHVGVAGVADRPLRLPSAEDVLSGRAVDQATIAEADAAASAAVDPQDDIHASAAYRRALVGTMVERALKRAAARAQQ